MKKLTEIVFVLLMAGFAACSETNNPGDDGWYDRIPDGGSFLRANTVRFYYLDGDGNGLIDPEDRSTLPVSLGRELDDPLGRTKDYKDGSYNGNHNSILFDDDEGLYYCMMSAYGDEKLSKFTWPVYVNGETDMMEAIYRYTDREVIGGKYWSKIVSWKYNGTHVYSDDEDGYDKKVFIIKSDGKTTVSLTRP